MLTGEGKDVIGYNLMLGKLERKDLCMIRIEARFDEIVVGRKRSGKPKKKRVCAVTAFLRFDNSPDVDLIQVNGTPVTFHDDGDDLKLLLPQVLVEIT